MILLVLIKYTDLIYYHSSVDKASTKKSLTVNESTANLDNNIASAVIFGGVNSGIIVTTILLIIVIVFNIFIYI